MTGGALPPEREGVPASDDLLARRARAAGTMPVDPPEERVIGGRRCFVIGDGPTLLWLHGGGYRMGSPVAYIALARRIAAAAGVQVVLPFYRLAPEHPFPAGLNDAVAVYRTLVADGPVIVAGDSAGGGLAAAVAQVAQAAGMPAAGAILLSPMLDLAARDATYDSHAARDPYISRAVVLDCAGLYLAGQSTDDPHASPIHADPAVLPPMLLLAGGHETLLGEALAFTAKLALADRAVTLHVAAGMGHVWPLLAPDSPATEDAVAAMAGFVRAQVAR
ncbi:alpha/beta hydrolase fold domain-containing protein [Sphingomonas jatrophae]|uniref:Acetyl esterase/lipase n=1 Tax=Sphingomonas jatrophae TaxID=1166337 RepID=A0A1I6KH60_9SPHN|nr:alpha/beta hydrolase fold domain-containing protein [Sphingomonas jatrophae]SFR90210.1 Acetyl esterase/lipase [Sphingomonas jatrophae]